MVRDDGVVAVVVAVVLTAVGAVGGSGRYPSYSVGVGPCVGRGASLGLQVEGRVNVNELGPRLVGPLAFLSEEGMPRFWLEGRWVPLSLDGVNVSTNVLSSLGPFWGFSGRYAAWSFGVTVGEWSGWRRTETWVVMVGGSLEETGAWKRRAWYDMGVWVTEYRLVPGLQGFFRPALRVMSTVSGGFDYWEVGVPWAAGGPRLYGFWYEAGVFRANQTFRWGLMMAWRPTPEPVDVNPAGLYVPIWVSWTLGGNVWPLTGRDEDLEGRWWPGRFRR